MAKKNVRETIKLRSAESSTVLWTTKSKRNTPQRLELRKYDKVLRRRVLFKEAR